jgi:formyltetrahydrofolate-dependent phosphoribosylglycinamide formyltransferase
MLNLHEWITSGRLNARIATVISSRGDAPGHARAKRAGLPATVIERRSTNDVDFQRRIGEGVAGADLVCMAGFLSLWRVPERLRGRVMNIHPALLPEFGGRGMYGRRVHEAVLAAGKNMSGCTVHFCDNEYDHGPIILQRQVPVLPDDTHESLAARVFEAECLAYPQAIELFGEGRLRLTDDRVEILPAGMGMNHRHQESTNAGEAKADRE